MTKHNTWKLKSSHSKLKKLKSKIKIGTKVTLNLLSKLIGNYNDDTNFPHKLLLTDTQDSRVRKVFASYSSANKKISKVPMFNIIQSGGILADLPELAGA